jgi:hypothetical protein
MSFVKGIQFVKHGWLVSVFWKKEYTHFDAKMRGRTWRNRILPISNEMERSRLVIKQGTKLSNKLENDNFTHCFIINRILSISIRFWTWKEEEWLTSLKGWKPNFALNPLFFVYFANNLCCLFFLFICTILKKWEKNLRKSFMPKQTQPKIKKGKVINEILPWKER